MSFVENRARWVAFLAMAMVFCYVLLLEVGIENRFIETVVYQTFFILILVSPIVFVCGLVLIRNVESGLRYWGVFAVLVSGSIIWEVGCQLFPVPQTMSIAKCSNSLRRFGFAAEEFRKHNHRPPTSAQEIGDFDLKPFLQLRPHHSAHGESALWTEDNFAVEFDKHYVFLGYASNQKAVYPIARDRLGHHEGVNILFSDFSVDYFRLDEILIDRPHLVTLDAAEIEALGYFDRRDYYEARKEK